MRMDENVSPEWVQQCQGSKSGRRALQEIERLTALVKVLESDDHEWYLQAARIEELETKNERLGTAGLDAQTRIEELEAEDKRLTMMLAEYVRLDNAGLIPLAEVSEDE